MKTSSLLVPGALLCLLLTSCVTTSDNPLSSPDAAQPDPKLIGTWHEKGDNDETMEFTIKDAHWMHVEDRKKDKPSESFDLFVTLIDGHRFLNVIHVGNDEQGHPFKKEFFIIRYEAANKLFTMWLIDQDKAATAVRAGKLKGTIREDKNGMMTGNPPHHDFDVELQDSGENMVHFLQHEGPKALFSDKPSEMIRVENASR